MRDPQKHRVYAWEAEWHDWNHSGLTLKECRDVVRWACHKYGVKPPRVAQHDGRAYSFSQGDPFNLISFRRDQKNAAIALHEAAHHISGKIFGNTIADHSPEWMGIYLWLLEGFRVAPRIALHASARAKRIRWVATWGVSPKRLRRRR